ncbi:UNVERIFIED_CONTAM: hypothetical protein GTU68_065841 [Idotea baltica]|nr:hypothetical protein [Idotea baltica]
MSFVSDSSFLGLDANLLLGLHLTNPFYVRRILAQEDCKLCVSPPSLQRLHDVTSKMIWEEYLLNDRPFIVEDGMKDWPVMNTNNFWFDNITDLYLSKDQEGIEPCEFGTNLRMPSNDLQNFLRTIHNPNIKHWFGHWENCDKRAAKALRPFYKRPYFIPNLVDLTDSNWVLMSSNYFSKNFHQIDFSTELLWVAQLRGWSKFRLAPREPCSTSCLPIDGSIKEGQMVVLTNFLWEFEYIPGEETDNLAIAVGGDWN